MRKYTFNDEEEETGDWSQADSGFQPLNAQEARQWRERHPALSPWHIVLCQAAAGFLASGLTWLVSGQGALAVSVLYGALAAVLPAAVLARAVMRKAGDARLALVSFFAWELIKLVLTIVLLAMAPKVVPGLSWPALLAGLIVVLMAHAFVLVWLGRRLSRR